ncbi:MAG TPA: sterol desaturase family protein [Rhodanobacteraceae bacterium]|nr:sterol desaturase family protein [Rhodanobacteraceae bacterium]
MALRSPWFLLIVATCVLLEWLWRSASRRGYDGRGAWVSLRVAGVRVIAAALGGVLLSGVFLGAARLAPWHLPFSDVRAWIAGFFLVEFVYYWQHRASHRVRWMWATHAVHHSADQMTLLSALRLGWTGVLSLDWVFYLAPVLLGFDPRMVIALLAFNLRYQFFLHTEAIRTLGPLEWIFNTPAHHRVHHGSNAEYLDCNYGGVLIVFDRLFGTLRLRKPDVPIRYGLAHPLPEQGVFATTFGEWKRLFADLRVAHDARTALRTALGNP